MITKSELLQRERWIYVGFPECQDLENLEGFDTNAVADTSDDCPGYFVDESWINDVLPD